MRRALLAGLTSCVLAACAGTPTGPAGTVKVSFREPERFIDLRLNRLRASGERERLLANLQAFLETEARTLVPEGSTLAITVTEVDMAGDFGSMGMPSVDMRIVGDGSPPRVDLEFSLTGPDGRIVKQGRRELRDPQFLLRPTISSDPLRFEKVLLGDWLDREFVPRR